MARMIALDPAPFVTLGSNRAWKLTATEAGRYGDGVRATVQVWNGDLQLARPVNLADSRQWPPVAAELAPQIGCSEEEILRHLRHLAGAVEGSLRQAEAASRRAPDEPEGHGQAIEFPDDHDAPWPELVDGAQLLDMIAATYRRYLILGPGVADLLALWTLFTHVHDAGTVSPILAIVSPLPRCGKTTTLQILSAMVARALPCSNITPAAIFRTIDRYAPTLIMDEADTYLNPEHDDLRGVLNSGHARGTAYVIRAVGEQHEPRRFSTWCPKAVALIGRLPATLADRAITVRLQRKLRSEHVDRWRHDYAAGLATLRRQARRWAEDHRDDLARADPAVPDELHDRAADNWRPLLALADLAGGDWPQRARAAIQAIERTDLDHEEWGILLLRDLRELYERKEADRLTSTEICRHLAGLEDRPWPTMADGRPINPHRLSRLLSVYGVSSKQIRIGDRTLKGYLRSDLDPLFSRYTTFATETSKHPAPGAASVAKPKRNTDPDVSLSKCPETADLTRDVSMFRFETRNSQKNQRGDARGPCPTCGHTDTGGRRGDDRALGDDRVASPATLGDARGDDGGRRGDASRKAGNPHGRRQGTMGDGGDATFPLHSYRGGQEEEGSV